LFSITILAILSAATTLGIRRTGIRAVASVAEVQEIPCLYPEWREAERRLPQHNKSLPFPEGDTGKWCCHPFRNEISNDLRDRPLHLFRQPGYRCGIWKYNSRNVRAFTESIR
jgi:hypothetical protein